MGVDLGFGCRLTPWETALGAGESGVENGCAALGEVAVGGFDGEDVGAEAVMERVKVGRIRKADARWRQRWQIMIFVIESMFRCCA
jgi:hypothetical protein